MVIRHILQCGFEFMVNPDYRFYTFAKKGRYDSMPDEEYLKRMYKAKMKKDLNLTTPRTFNEKLQWLKIHDRKPIYTTMVDKYEAKKYVASIIGKDYIIPTLGVWDRFDEINFDMLPNQFVLKCTHDSGGLVICRDKNKLDKKVARKKINKSLKRNYYWLGREWPYKNVKPRIIAEKYMQETQQDATCTAENVLTDYKFFCFNGVPRIMYVSKDTSNNPRTDFFDMEYQHLPIKMKDPNSRPDELPECPSQFDEMKRIAQILSAGIPHLRVDFYIIDGQLYVGELTFFHMSGFARIQPQEWDCKLGEWIELPEKTR